jgi:hypothetical protein
MNTQQLIDALKKNGYEVFIEKDYDGSTIYAINNVGIQIYWSLSECTFTSVANQLLARDEKVVKASALHQKAQDVIDHSERLRHILPDEYIKVLDALKAAL